MEFITVEQFKEQPEEVQKVFLDWWECEPYDLYAFPWNRRTNTWCIGSCSNQIQANSINKSKDIDINIPTFTEGQIRRFIEDKTGAKVISAISYDEQYIIALIKNNNELYEMKDTEEEDLLQAYWKVACIIAKEDV